MIIQKSNPAHARFPASLEGEYFIQDIHDNEGNVIGFVTTDVATVRMMRTKAPTECTECGWDSPGHKRALADKKAVPDL